MQHTAPPAYTGRIRGGSAGSASAGVSRALGLINADLNLVFGSDNLAGPGNGIGILPSFDPNMPPSDKAFQTSFVPYRWDSADAGLDLDTQTPAFSDWFAVLPAHRVVGNGGESFLSPSVLAQVVGARDVDSADPVNDMYQVAYKAGIPEWKALTARDDTANKPAKLSRSSQLVFCNVRIDKSGASAPEYGLMMMSGAALREIKTQLSMFTPSEVTPRDQRWRKFVLGDVTYPDTYLPGMLRKRKPGTSNMFVWCLDFIQRADSPPLCKGFQLTQNDLVQRADLLDVSSGNVFLVHSYQKIVDWLVGDGMFPRELILRACGARANVPVTQPTSFAAAVHVQQPDYGQDSVHRTPVPAYASAPPADDAIPGLGGGDDSFSNPPPAAMPMVHQSPSPPVAPSTPKTLYWINVPGVGADPSVRLSAQEIMTRSDLAAIQLCSCDNPSEGWKPAAAFGFVTAPPPAPVAMPAPAPVNMPPPAAPVAQAMPSAPGASAASGPLSPAELAELAGLKEVVMARTAMPEQYARFMTLSQRATASGQPIG